MTSDYWFDVILTIPSWMKDDLPETPEPTVSFMHSDYIDHYHYKPNDPIISETQMRKFLEENGIETDKCMIMQKPRSETFEAIINGHQVHRIHWVIECVFNEDKEQAIIPKEARTFIDSVHRITHENCLTRMEITHDISPWEDSWIHKRVSYSEFKAHALCNEADSLLDSIDGTINESIEQNIREVRIRMDKTIETLRDSIFRQHSSLLSDVRSFEDRIKKTISKPQRIINYEKTIDELTKKNDILLNKLIDGKLYMTILTIVQLSLIALLLFHYFSH